MAWIESHQKLEKHPKTINLANMMGWDLDQTIGKLHRLWWWCQEYAEDGDLRRYSESQLASVVGLNPQEGKKFVDVMITCAGQNYSGFFENDPYFRIHDWWDYNGKFLQIKYKNSSSKWKAVRRKYKGNFKNTPNNGSKNVPNNTPKRSIPNLTLPNLTNKPPNPLSGGGAFEVLWAKYPKRIDEKKARKSFEASVKNPEDLKAIQKALENYLKSKRVTSGYVQDGFRWFREDSWRSWIDFQEPLNGNGAHQETDDERYLRLLSDCKCPTCRPPGTIKLEPDEKYRCRSCNHDYTLEFQKLKIFAGATKPI